MENEKIVLGIETSCDDTSLCLLRGLPGKDHQGYPSEKPPQVLAHSSFSQEILLRKWGGVVPEIAARNHLAKLVPLLESVMEKAQVSPEEIDLLAVTNRPGLLGPLLTGINLAKTLSLYLEKPLLPVNHLYAHLEAIHLTQSVAYPYVGLLVSGGHSLYLLVRSSIEFEIIGSTIDDAAGEAFDKGGKLLGLGYPAGRIIDNLAKQGDPYRFAFPIGLKESSSADLSFSGVKTALRVFLEKNPELVVRGTPDSFDQIFLDVCASYQQAIVHALALKLKNALRLIKEKYPALPSDLPIVVGGGVACNSALRNRLIQDFPQTSFVPPQFCTDNGAMIANYALLNFEDALPFPQSLEIDAQGKFIEKWDSRNSPSSPPASRQRK